jgi:hypothetical protein
MAETPKVLSGKEERQPLVSALADDVLALLRRTELPELREVTAITDRLKAAGWTSEEIVDALHAVGDDYIELVSNALAKKSVGWLIGTAKRGFATGA